MDDDQLEASIRIERLERELEERRKLGPIDRPHQAARPTDWDEAADRITMLEAVVTQLMDVVVRQAVVNERLHQANNVGRTAENVLRRHREALTRLQYQVRDFIPQPEDDDRP